MKKNSCTWINKHLVPFCENNLPPDLQKEIRVHLSQCPRCEKRAQDFFAIWNHLAAQNEPTQGVSLWPALARAIQEQSGESRQTRGFFQRIPRLLRPAAAALGFVIAIGTGWELGSSSRSGLDIQLNLGQTEAEEMYISEYLEPFNDLPLGSLADLYLDSDSPDKETKP